MTSETDHELSLEALDQVNGGGLPLTPRSIQQSLSSALAMYRFMHAWDGFGAAVQKAARH